MQNRGSHVDSEYGTELVLYRNIPFIHARSQYGPPEGSLIALWGISINKYFPQKLLLPLRCIEILQVLRICVGLVQSVYLRLQIFQSWRLFGYAFFSN